MIGSNYILHKADKDICTYAVVSTVVEYPPRSGMLEAGKRYQYNNFGYPKGVDRNGTPRGLMPYRDIRTAWGTYMYLNWSHKKGLRRHPVKLYKATIPAGTEYYAEITDDDEDTLYSHFIAISTREVTWDDCMAEISQGWFNHKYAPMEEAATYDH